MPQCIRVGSQSSDEPKKKTVKKLKPSKALSWQENYSFANAGPNHAAGLKYYMRNEVMDQKMNFIWGWEGIASLKHDDEFAGKSQAINGQVLPPLDVQHRCQRMRLVEEVRQILLNVMSNDGAIGAA